MNISPEALQILKESTIENNTLALPARQLDRKLYVEVNRVLENTGGQWKRGLKVHVFPSDPSTILGLNIDAGRFVDKKKELQAFYTPQDVAERVVERACLTEGMRVLEPSAGNGALADEIVKTGAKVVCVEINPEEAKKLRERFNTVFEQDFLTVPVFEVDAVVANPPFTKDQDIKHVLNAYDFLKSGGRLVAIMSPGFTFGGNKRRTAFREFVEEHGMWESLPEGSFKESGTNVNTVVVTLRK